VHGHDGLALGLVALAGDLHPPAVEGAQPRLESVRDQPALAILALEPPALDRLLPGAASMRTIAVNASARGRAAATCGVGDRGAGAAAQPQSSSSPTSRRTLSG
jgi:hypothetical protein